MLNFFTNFSLDQIMLKQESAFKEFECSVHQNNAIVRIYAIQPGESCHKEHFLFCSKIILSSLQIMVVFDF